MHYALNMVSRSLFCLNFYDRHIIGSILIITFTNNVNSSERPPATVLLDRMFAVALRVQLSEGALLIVISKVFYIGLFHVESKF